MARRKSNKQVKAMIESLTGAEYYSLVNYKQNNYGEIVDKSKVKGSYHLRFNGRPVSIKANQEEV